MPNDPAVNSYVEINFSPSWQLISDVRRFVSVFYLRTLNEPDVAGRVALAAHELLENATKYSRDGEAKLRLEVSTKESGHIVGISIVNRACPKEIERLKQYFASMQEEDDTFAFYQKLIQSARGRDDRAGLGLARIQAEAEIKLRLTVDGEMVKIQGQSGIISSSPNKIEGKTK
jgi:hypothetical protein